MYRSPDFGSGRYKRSSGAGSEARTRNRSGAAMSPSTTVLLAHDRNRGLLQNEKIEHLKSE
jgi:hypothetical protein